MVTVAYNHITDILLPAIIEKLLIVSGFPFVESLVNDQKADRVAIVQEFRRRRIVRTTDGIDTELFQNSQAAFVGTVRNCHAQATGILVQTHTFHLNILPIQEKALILIKMDGTYPKAGRITVYYLTSLFQYNLQMVQVGIFKTPQLRIGNRKRLLYVFGPVLRYHDIRPDCIPFPIYLQRIAMRIDQLLFHFNFPC